MSKLKSRGKNGRYNKLNCKKRHHLQNADRCDVLARIAVCMSLGRLMAGFEMVFGYSMAHMELDAIVQSNS